MFCKKNIDGRFAYSVSSVVIVIVMQSDEKCRRCTMITVGDEKLNEERQIDQI